MHKTIIAALAAFMTFHPETILAKGQRDKDHDPIATFLINLEEKNKTPHYDHELFEELLHDSLGYEYFNPRTYTLSVIGTLESDNRYNVINGGQIFHTFDDHPKICRKLPEGNCSSAAGRYQITYSTWKHYIEKMKREENILITDFSPKNQDLVAWYIARDKYRGNLEKDLLEMNKHVVLKTLQDTWIALRKLPISES